MGSIKFQEHPRGGSDNRPIENEMEYHLPCAVILDISGSMDVVKDQLDEGLRLLCDSLSDQARGRVEFCIIGFSDNAKILEPFGPAYDYKVPVYTCQGSTAMHKAVDYALREIETRKAQYKQIGTPYYRPWIYLLTDGYSNDADNGAFERLKAAQHNKHCIFFPVAIGETADIATLKTLNINNVVLKASKDNFIGAFEWLSNSLSSTSGSKPGEKVQLDNPVEYQLQVIS